MWKISSTMIIIDKQHRKKINSLLMPCFTSNPIWDHTYRIPCHNIKVNCKEKTKKFVKKVAKEKKTSKKITVIDIISQSKCITKTLTTTRFQQVCRFSRNHRVGSKVHQSHLSKSKKENHELRASALTTRGPGTCGHSKCHFLTLTGILVILKRAKHVVWDQILIVIVNGWVLRTTTNSVWHVGLLGYL